MIYISCYNYPVLINPRRVITHLLITPRGPLIQLPCVHYSWASRRNKQPIGRRYRGRIFVRRISSSTRRTRKQRYTTAFSNESTSYLPRAGIDKFHGKHVGKQAQDDLPVYKNEPAKRERNVDRKSERVRRKMEGGRDERKLQNGGVPSAGEIAKLN